jgi:hypothetical protein
MFSTVRPPAGRLLELPGAAAGEKARATQLAGGHGGGGRCGRAGLGPANGMRSVNTLSV